MHQGLAWARRPCTRLREQMLGRLERRLTSSAPTLETATLVQQSTRLLHDKTTHWRHERWMTTRVLPPSQVRGDLDDEAERVARRVGVDPERLVFVHDCVIRKTARAEGDRLLLR